MNHLSPFSIERSLCAEMDSNNLMHMNSEITSTLELEFKIRINPLYLRALKNKIDEAKNSSLGKASSS